MMNIRRLNLTLLSGVIACALVISPGQVSAWNSKDGTLELHGFLDNTYHNRDDYGITKERVRGQIEWSKVFKPTGLFSEFSFHGTLRATYDGVYDLNDDEFGDRSGGSVSVVSSGTAIRTTGLPNITPGHPLWGTDEWGNSPVKAGVPALPGGGGFGFDTVANPNEGLKRVGGELGASNNNGEFGGGLEFFTPTRPCDVDSRGCIPGYMDATLDDLRFPEFTDDHGWLREIYIDATMPVNNGDEINFRIGRQQVVWGRTDLFRVLDQVNPIDFSIQSIYEEFEDSRIPVGIFSAEYRAGAVGAFDDLNFQVIWNFEKFRPNTLGQGGQPYNILLAGDIFRALKNCWDNGCTINNFATGNPPDFPNGLAPDGNLATDFPAHVVGIRDINLPGWDFDQGGVRLEGVFRSVGFSINAMTFYSQLPSLRGGIPSVNPFVGTTIPEGGCPPAFVSPDFAICNPIFPGQPYGSNPFDPTDTSGLERVRPYVPAFDIHFPRVTLVGASADFYVDPIKSAIRMEMAHTSGEEFADTSKSDLHSESDVIRWVIGWDRPTYIRWLNPNRTFLLSAQIFGQHILDHKSISHPGTGSQIGFQDWKNGYIGTFLFQGFFANDRILPRLILARDFRAKATVLGPAVDYLINDNLRLIFGANIKLGTGRRVADDGRTSNSFPPFTAGPACNPAGGSVAPCLPGNETSSLGIRRGFEPLGRFRSGPLGMAQHEDEFQILIRYRF